jgi:hypothetical protein
MSFRVACAVAGAVALLAGSTAQAGVVWTQWTTNATGAAGDVNVTYAGEFSGLIFPGGGSFEGYIPNSSFTGGPVTNVPTNENGALKLLGGGGDAAVTDTITFSRALYNPVFLIWSLGQGNLPTSFNFQGSPSISIVAGGPTAQYGGGPLSLMSSTTVGVEGNGVLQFHGAVSSISWTNPTREDYYAFTVGNVVPEPAAWALMLLGFGGLGATLRQRRARTAAAA